MEEAFRAEATARARARPAWSGDSDTRGMDGATEADQARDVGFFGVRDQPSEVPAISPPGGDAAVVDAGATEMLVLDPGVGAFGHGASVGVPNCPIRLTITQVRR
jgi:hypothetical protein